MQTHVKYLVFAAGNERAWGIFVRLASLEAEQGVVAVWHPLENKSPANC